MLAFANSRDLARWASTKDPNAPLLRDLSLLLQLMEWNVNDNATP